MITLRRLRLTAVVICLIIGLVARTEHPALTGIAWLGAAILLLLEALEPNENEL